MGILLIVIGLVIMTVLADKGDSDFVGGSCRWNLCSGYGRLKYR